MGDNIVPPSHYMQENRIVNIDHLIKLLEKSIEIQGNKKLTDFKSNIFDYDNFVFDEEDKEKIKGLLLNLDLNNKENRNNIIIEITSIIEKQIDKILEILEKKNFDKSKLLPFVEHDFTDDLKRLNNFMEKFNEKDVDDKPEINRLKFILIEFETNDLGLSVSRIFEGMSKFERYKKYKELLIKYEEIYSTYFNRDNPDLETNEREFNELFDELLREVEKYIDKRTFFLGGRMKNVIRIRRIKKYK